MSGARDRACGIAAAAAMCAVAAVACTEIGPGGVPASIAFNAFPWPSVVLGDSLRNPDGLPVPLTASVFDARNQPLPDADVRFISLDTTIAITDDGFVTGEAFGTARIVAEVAGLQTSALTLIVTREPDTLRAIGDTLLPVEYALPDVTTQKLAVHVAHLAPPTPADTAVPGWIVQFAIVGQTPGDTTRGYLVRENTTIKASVDTTDAAGRAVMEFRLNPITFPVVQDTVEVVATANHKGEPVPGSPVRFVLYIRPEPAP